MDTMKSQYRQTIAVKSNQEMLRLLPNLLRSGDNVVEIGSLLGDITQTIKDCVNKDGTVTAFDFHRKKSTRDGARATDTMEGVDFHLLTGEKHRFANGAQKSPFAVASYILQILLSKAQSISNKDGNNNTLPQYNVVILDLSNMYGNEIFLDFVAAIDIYKSIFNALGMQYLIVKSNFMRAAARKYFNAAQLIDKSRQVPNTRCNIMYNQFLLELQDAIRGQNVGYLDAGPVVLGGRGVNEYRKASLLCIQPGDRVLEIGAHCGKTTKLVADNGASAVGVDIGPHIVQEAIKRYPDVEFHVADAWDINTLMALSKTKTKTTKKASDDVDGGDGVGNKEEKEKTDDISENEFEFGWDVILVDVGGLSGDNGLFESLGLLRELSHMFRPRLKALVIKSACIRSFASDIMPGDSFVYLKKTKEEEILKKKTKDTIEMVPVFYETCQGAGSEMVEATFVGVDCDEPIACKIGGQIKVDAKVGGGWVFCGIELGDWNGYGAGPSMKVTGGTFELLESPNGAVWSGDESIGRFAITHDGVSDKIVVEYGTRAD